MKNNFLSQKFLIFIFIFMISFCCLVLPSKAVDLDKDYVQKIDTEFWTQLKANTSSERALFLTNPLQQSFILYARHTDQKYIIRGTLSAAHENLILPFLQECDFALFSPLKSNNEPLYSHGLAYQGNIGLATFTYVAHFVDGKPSDAFISDLGYLELIWSNPPQDDLKLVLSKLRLMLQPTVKYNRYYLYRDRYYGPVNEFCYSASHNVLFPTIHKITFNKKISDKTEKIHLDKKLFLEILAMDGCLLSQDMRLKLGFVDPAVRIDFNRIDETDIGSGQNHLTFLTIGPGINYFDDPWLTEPNNVPGPRIIFNPQIIDLYPLQIYPSYSIDTPGNGDLRLSAINEVQTELKSNGRSVVWADLKTRIKLYKAIEEELCRHGLTDSGNKKGFTLDGKQYGGNIVNNEIRILHFASVRDMTQSVIVPQGTLNSYQQDYFLTLDSSSPHWMYVCGIHYKHLFCEAPQKTDKAFRATWLHYITSHSHPTLAKIMSLAKQTKPDTSYYMLAELISKMAQKYGTEFFVTEQYKYYIKQDKQRNELWLDYLEAYRNKELDKAQALLTKYKLFYEHFARKFFDYKP